MLTNLRGEDLFMSEAARWAVGLVVASVSVSCSVERPGVAKAANSVALIDPCAARNPTQLFTGVAERETGTPRLDVFRFDLPARAPICLRVINPSVKGHRVTAAELVLDGEELLSEEDFNQTVGEYALSRTLDAGSHRLEVRVRSKPGTRLELTVAAPGPTLDDFTPVVGEVGSSLTLRGSGFYGPLSVSVGGVELNGAIAAAPNLAVATTVPDLPIGRLTISTPFGSATSNGVFTPSSPRGAVPFYPRADLAVSDLGSCVEPSRLRVVQDGTRVSFVIDFQRPLPQDVAVAVAIDDDARPSTVEFTLTARRQGTSTTASGATDVLGAIDGSSAVLSSTFSGLRLNDIHRMGRMFVRVSASAGCGSATLPATTSALEPRGFHEVRSLFAPGLVLVKTAAPLLVAARNGTQLIASDPESDIVLMSIPAEARLEDLLVQLAEDDDVQGAAPDPVFYRASHISGGPGCGLPTIPPSSPGPVFETAASPLAPQGQWTLEQIGLVAHPSPASGAGVVVAVLDTGVDPHPDVAPNLLTGVDRTLFGDGTTVDNDPGVGHGTGIASIIASVQGNGGMVGVAPGASILPVRVVNFVGLGEAFSVFTALGVVIGPAAGRGGIPAPQVVNVSVNEDLNAAAFIDAMTLPMPAPKFALMIAIGVAMESRATAVVATGAALVASAGSGPGLQYPANVPGAFAIVQLGNNRSPVMPAPAAGAGQTIALAAPTSEISATGLAVPGIRMARRGPSGDYVCATGSSFAAALVSGAIATVLAPPPPSLPAAFTGAAAARLLMTTATPLVDSAGAPFPRNRVGAGELNLRATFAPPLAFPLGWSLIFETPRGGIDDFAFLPGVGDFALRGGGMVLETLTAPIGDDTVRLVATFSESKSWMVELGGTNTLAFGTSTGIEVRGADGVLLGTLTGASPFRAAISPAVGGTTPLVAMGAPGGGIRIRRTDALIGGADLATVPPPAGGPIIAAQWATMPAPLPVSPVGGPPAPPDPPLEPLVLAARSAASVDYYRVPANVQACPTTPSECPVLLGNSDIMALAGISDWALTAGISGPTSYFVNGSSSVFIAPMNLPVVPILVGISTSSPESYVALAANPRVETVYAVDIANARFTLLRGATIVGSDTRFGRSPSVQFSTTSLMRIAPSGTYGYIKSEASRLEGSAILDHAIFVGSLAQ